MAACVIGLIFFASMTLFRDSLSVSVSKIPPSLEVKQIQEAVDITDISKPLCAKAGVTWSFQCETNMKYSYVEKVKMGERWTVTIRIDEISMRLSLPIAKTLPVKPPERLAQHNDGHVQICNKVYSAAEEYAKEACQPIFKRTYTADGDTVDEASAKAVGMANDEVIESYKQKTQEQTQSISDAYDLLELSRPPSHKHSVEKANELYHAGKKRRL